MKEFNSADANKDGKLSRAEWIARFGSDDHFDEYDLDHDGFVDADEFMKGKQRERYEREMEEMKEALKDNRGDVPSEPPATPTVDKHLSRPKSPGRPQSPGRRVSPER